MLGSVQLGRPGTCAHNIGLSSIAFTFRVPARAASYRSPEPPYHLDDVAGRPEPYRLAKLLMGFCAQEEDLS